jgi:ubiquinone/menaquinone biosynthesis C-methylase UbiE
MTISKLVARQLSNPTGILAGIAAFVWNRRNAALNDRVLNLLSLQPFDRVLDVGFGGGYLLKRMSTIATDGLLAGVDISSAMVAEGKKRYQKEIKSGRLDLKCGTVESLPYPTKNFTKVCSINSIFYWQDAKQGLREIMRVLVEGGYVVLCFTSKASIEKKGFARSIKLYDPITVEQMLTEHGFQETQTLAFSDKYRQYFCMTAKKAP